MKNTKSRQTILDFISKQNEPVSANQIFENLKQNNITLSTVYRTVSTFVDAKIINKMETKDGVGLYSVHKDSHSHYLECTGCHKRARLDFCPYTKVKQEIKKQNGFEISDDQILYGLCNECNKK